MKLPDSGDCLDYFQWLIGPHFKIIPTKRLNMSTYVICRWTSPLLWSPWQNCDKKTIFFVMLTFRLAFYCTSLASHVAPIQRKIFGWSPKDSRWHRAALLCWKMTRQRGSLGLYRKESTEFGIVSSSGMHTCLEYTQDRLFWSEKSRNQTFV